jgi:hypothetical protein
VLVSADPVNFAGVAAVTLAATGMVVGDFVIEAGTLTDARKVTIGSKTGITPTADGTGTHIALVDDTGTDLLLLVPIPSTAVVTSTNIDFATWEHEMLQNEAG